MYGPRVRDRETADRALRKLLVTIDEGRVGVGRRDTTTTFRQWSDAFEAILEGNGRRASTVRAYRPTLDYGRDAFGSVPLRSIDNDDLRKFVHAIRNNGGSDATVGKHLRHLSAVMQQAVEDNKLDTNPVPRFRKRLGLRVPRGTPAYTDEELAKLWAQMEKLEYPSVYIAAFKFATATGVRVGELIALDWADVDLGNRLLHIRHSYDARDGLTPPKDQEARIVYLTPSAVAVLERWVAVQGARKEGPVFTAPRTSERLAARWLVKLLENARTKASIPKLGEDGRPRKPLHSLRASFTRIMREAGVDPAFVQASLGHSTLDLTENVYGRWGAAALRKTADGVDSAAFPV